MLKIAVIDDKSRIEQFCACHPLGVRITCLMDSYGFDYDFVKIWYGEMDNEINCVLSSFDSCITLCADYSADFEEIHAFVNSLGYSQLICESEILKKCSFELSIEKQMFVYSSSCDEKYDDVVSGGDLKKAYKLISSAIPGSFDSSEEAYMHFLSDFTFRQRRNTARIKTISENGEVISCAMTAAESKTSALISGVACNSSYRGKGLGKRNVLSLANELKNEGKKVYVIALNDSAKAFYKKIGFSECITVSYSEG